MSIFQNYRVVKALSFAIDAHQGQRRKCGVVHYITHPFGVAALVEANDGTEDQVIAALLHDVKEDCSEEFGDQILPLFGPNVDRMVDDLTNTSKRTHPHLNRTTRKVMDNQRLETIGLDAKLVKLCDIKYNVQDLQGLDEGFRMLFLREKLTQVRHVMIGVSANDPVHHQLADEITHYIKGKLNEYY